MVKNIIEKKSKLIVILALLLCLLCSVAVLSVGRKTVSADGSEEYFRLSDGASIRKESGVGMRFKAVASSAFVDRIAAIDQNAEYGILLIPTNLLSGELTVNTSKAKEGIKQAWDETGEEYTFFVALIGSENLEDYPSKQYNRYISARAFVRYTDQNEETVVEYSENTVSRNIAQVASKALAKGESDPNGVMDAILNTAFTAAGADLEAESYFPQEFSVVSGKEITPAVVFDDCGFGYAVKYESEDSSVVAVSSSGVITGVSAGTAKVTASVGSANKITFNVTVAASDGVVENLLLDSSHTYSGRLANGVPQTSGEESATLTYIKDNSTYVGKFAAGLPTVGRRTFARDTGLLYVDTVAGAMTGFDTFDNSVTAEGYFKYAKGHYCIGEMKVNSDGGGCTLEGNGTFYYTSGDTYVGQFKGGTFNGKGTFTYKGGATYVGDFESGQFNGSGTFTWANGTNIVGTFAKGKATYGKKTMANRTTGLIWYEGDCDSTDLFSTGSSHVGRGYYVYDSGKTYEGEMYLTNGYLGNNAMKAHGTGTVVWDANSQFTGTFKDDYATYGKYATNKTSTGVVWFEGETESVALGSFVGAMKTNVNGTGYFYYSDTKCWYEGGMYLTGTTNVWTCNATFNDNGNAKFYWPGSGWLLSNAVVTDGVYSYGRITRTALADNAQGLHWFEGAMTSSTNFVNGTQGSGYFVYSSGATYEGEMIINDTNITANKLTFSGEGTFTWDAYSTFTGTFANGNATYGTYTRPKSTTGILYFTGTCTGTGTFATETAGTGKWVSADATETYEGTMYLTDGNIWANAWHK